MLGAAGPKAVGLWHSTELLVKTKWLLITSDNRGAILLLINK